MHFERAVDSRRRVVVLVLLLSLVVLPDGRSLLLGQIRDAPQEERSIRVDPEVRPVPAGESGGGAGRKWAVIIGVDAYLDERIPALRYGAADANLVARTLVERGGFLAEHVIVLADKQTKPHLLPLAENIDKQIKYVLGQARAGDTVLIHFSGHGFLNDQGEGFLAPLNCRRDQLEETSLSTGKLRELLEGCQAKHKLLVLDCCHAGADRQADADSGATGEELGIAFREARGTITLASCLAQQVSLEWDHVGHGLFTYFFAQALAGAADADRNGIVDSDEVYAYVLEQVEGTSRRVLNRVQTPVRFIPPTTVGKFPLARVQSGPVAGPDGVPPYGGEQAEPTLAGADLRLFELDVRAARNQYEHTGAGTPIDSVVDGGARWSPKQAFFAAKPAVAQVYGKAVVAGQWAGYWYVPADGNYTFQFESRGHGWNKGGCCLRVQIGVQQVLDSVFGVYGLGRQTPCTKTVALKQGWQPVVIWLSTTGDYDDVVPTIRFRAPGTDEFTTLTPAMLKRQ